jgi:hypothetical protein
MLSLSRLITSVAAFAAAVAVLLVVNAPSAYAGQFGVSCRFSHRAMDDPIVDPGMPGMSHLHDFFGSADTSSKSTYASMQKAKTTCSDVMDTAGYWQPHLTVNGHGATAHLTAWYSKGGKPTVVPFPKGIMLIAGDHMATAPQPKRVLAWSCAGRGGHHGRYDHVPQCGTHQNLTATLGFPDCWDGKHLDTPDHRSHARYSHNGVCPDGFTVPLPRLALVFRWPIHPKPSSVQLASGGPLTMHADFWNTWHQWRLRELINSCVNVNTDCGVVHHGT